MQIRRSISALARGAWFVALCAALHAQNANNIIHIRLLDGRTGLPVNPSNFLVRVDHNETVHNEWVHINDDGTVLVTVPASAAEISVKATYDMSMQTYINCDAAKENDKERDIWYPIPAIVATGTVAPNECGKTNYKAQPGEFIFFVRKRSWHDKQDF